jgi:outer membrane receptor protein involved in Fe transport
LAPAAVLLAASFLHGKEIRGRVLTRQGKPVAEAVVLHRPSGLKAMTGTDGSFRLNLDTADKIRLEIIHADYQEEELIVPAGANDATVEIIMAPLIRQREEIVVTALRYPEPSMSVPAAGSVLLAESLEEGLAPSLTFGVETLPGVSSLGSGGFSLVPAVRGLARNRVLFLVDFARVSSDRRTGPNASFLFPEDMARVEVLRSPSSVYYGSDAVGGVFQVFLREPDPRPGVHGRISARAGSGNGEKSLGASLSARRGGLGFYVSLQGTDAGSYRHAEGTVPMSGYSQWSLTAKLSFRSEKRRIDMSFLRSRGVNIGKPALDSLTRPTWYPRENINLAQFRWLESRVAGGELAFHAYLNPNFLETRTDRLETSQTRESSSRTESTDFGAQLSFNRPAARGLRLNSGLDLSGRSKARSFNRDAVLDEQGRPLSTFEETPYADGSRIDLGAFLALDFNRVKNLDVMAGLRWDRLEAEADPGGRGQSARREESALSAFMAASYRLSEWTVFFVNLSRAYRAPTLGERFYTGITGRGFIISRPDLEAERSVNADAGLKIAAPRFYAAVSAFRYDIDGLIERILVTDKAYTYANVDRGRIQGGEVEGEWFPRNGVKLFGNVSFARGRSVRTGQPLNDIPPVKILAGVRVWAGRLSGEACVRHHRAKSDPGPAEIAVPAGTTADLKLCVYLPAGFQVNALVSNVFDALDLNRPDPDAPPDPGRSVRIGVVYSF